jgi:phage baseplate assembly protein V
MADISGIIDRRIARAMNSVRRAFRGVLTRVTSDNGVQTTQVSGLAGETLEDIEMFQQYGITSVPPAGTMAVVLPLGGKTTHGIVIATENSRYRVQALESGEVAIYTDEGATIVLKRNKVIEHTCDDYVVNCKRYSVNAEESATFETPALTASQEVIAQGQISGNGGMAIKGGENGATATFTGNVKHSDGTIDTDGDVVIKTIPMGGHKHQTPDGLSEGPQAG